MGVSIHITEFVTSRKTWPSHSAAPQYECEGVVFPLILPKHLITTALLLIILNINPVQQQHNVPSMGQAFNSFKIGSQNLMELYVKSWKYMYNQISFLGIDIYCHFLNPIQCWPQWQQRKFHQSLQFKLMWNVTLKSLTLFWKMRTGVTEQHT